MRVYGRLCQRQSVECFELLSSVRLLKKEEDGWLKFYYIASTYASERDFAMAFIYAERALACEDADKDSKDYLRYCCGFFLLACDQVERGLAYLKTSQYPDAIYIRAINSTKRNDIITLLEKFMAMPMPTSSPTRWPDYRIQGKQLLREIYETKILELQDA